MRRAVPRLPLIVAGPQDHLQGPSPQVESIERLAQHQLGIR